MKRYLLILIVTFIFSSLNVLSASVNLEDYMLLNSEIPTSLSLRPFDSELGKIGLTNNPGFNENKNLLNGLYENINISAIDKMYMAFYDENVKDPKYNGVLVAALKLKSNSALKEEVNKISSDTDINFPVMHDDFVIVFIDEISFDLKYGEEISNKLENRLQLKRILVSAENYFVVVDKSSAEDVILLKKIIQDLKGDLGDNYVTRLTSEIKKEDLDNRVTLFIYKESALIIVADKSTSEQATLANDMSNLLKEKYGITAITKLISEIRNDDLTKEIEIIYCTDTDGGINQYENGVTKGAYIGDAKREIRDYFDYCVSLHGGLKNGILSEAYCEDGLVKTQWIDCDYGCSGNDKQGVCLKHTEQKTKEDLPVPIAEEPKIDSKDFEQKFLLLDQKDNDAIKEFINKIGIEKWHILVNHGRFRSYYVLRDSLRTRYGQSQGDAEFDRLYGTDIIDLKNFPNIFNYGGTFNGVIVVGEYATDKEKEVARYVHTSIKNFFSPPQNWPMEPFYIDSYLYKDDNDFVRNIITIGSPCNNKATAEIIHTSSCDSGLKEGESKIQLWDNDDFAQLAIVANSDEDLMIAAKYLVEHLNNNNPTYTDEKFKGREIILGTCDGCFSRPDCIPFLQRVNSKYCDSDKKLKNQKQAGDSCTNKYECVNNICKNNICKPYCEGCYNEEDNCVPIGTRSKDTYCSTSQEMTNQKGEDSDCNNNYECSSNVCVNNQCISPSLLQKIIDWFKKLFG